MKASNRSRPFRRVFLAAAVMLGIAAGGCAADTAAEDPSAQDNGMSARQRDNLDKYILHMPCCMLTPTKSASDPMSLLLGIDDLGHHSPLDVEALTKLAANPVETLRQVLFEGKTDGLPIVPEHVGIMYTRRGGFMDLAHIRMISDIMHRFHDQIARKGGKKGEVIVSFRSTTTLTRDVPKEDWIRVAQSMAYDEFLAHEVAAYGHGKISIPKALHTFLVQRGLDLPQDISPGIHPSSFSPEDLPSNFVGVTVAGRAIARVEKEGGDFNSAFDVELEAALRDLSPVDKPTSLRAFQAVNGTWVVFENYLSFLGYEYTQRRHFDRTPWKVPGMSEETPAWVSASFGDARDNYQLTMRELGEAIRSDEVDGLVEAVRARAKADYGPMADSPELGSKTSAR